MEEMTPEIVAKIIELAKGYNSLTTIGKSTNLPVGRVKRILKLHGIASKPKDRIETLRINHMDMSSHNARKLVRNTIDIKDQTCEICQAKATIRALDVDHNHTTGKYRGLLCNSCNKALGLLQDNPMLTSRATTYLLEK